MATIFRLHSGTGAGPDALADDLAPDLALGPWVADARTATQPDQPLSFMSDGAHQPPTQPRWCVDIDRASVDDLAAAHREFDRGESAVKRTEAMLDSALDRIDAAVAQATHPPAQDPDRGQGPLMFLQVAPEPTIQLFGPEAELFEELLVVRGQPTANKLGAGPLSFASGLDDDDDKRATESHWRQLANDARSAMNRISRVATHPSWVETRVAGRLVARTAVTWTGDTENLAARRLSTELVAIHTRSVSISLRTRMAWSRLLITVVRGSAKLAAVSGPMGAFTAVPMAWKFVRSIVAEVKELRAIES